MNITEKVIRLKSKIIEHKWWSLILFTIFTCLWCKGNNSIPFIVFTKLSNDNLINVIIKVSFYIIKKILTDRNLLRVYEWIW